MRLLVRVLDILYNTDVMALIRRLLGRETKLEEMLRLKKPPDMIVPKVYNTNEVIRKHMAGED